MNKRQRKKKFKKELRRKALIYIATHDPDKLPIVYFPIFPTIKLFDLKCRECCEIIENPIYVKTRAKGMSEEQDFNLCTKCKQNETKD